MQPTSFTRLVHSLDVTFEYWLNMKKVLDRNFGGPTGMLDGIVMLGVGRQPDNSYDIDGKDTIVKLHDAVYELAHDVSLYAGPFLERNVTFYDMPVPSNGNGAYDAMMSNYIRVMRAYDIRINLYAWRIDCLFKAT